jgi:very-short-patch-repair endonuclease
LEAAILNVNDLLQSLGKIIGWPENYLNGAKFDEITTRIQGLIENPRKSQAWNAFNQVRVQACKGLANELINSAMEGQIDFTDLTSVFQRSFYQKWLALVLQARKSLLEFNTLLHEQRITEFKELDQRILTENKNRLIRKVRDDIQKKLQEGPAVQAMSVLRREMARQRGLSPLRRTLKHAGPAIRAIKPCFMMSPLTVAQHLDSSQPGFDLVIFDEASQLPAEDAVGAISRAKQLVVVGDPKQLPPTNFFGVMNGQISAVFGEDGLPLYEDGESILEELMAAGLPTSRLKWHYRSAHESLIQFSNANFYDSELYTFPSVDFVGEELGVSFEYIENGVYEGKGLNLLEARRVVDAVEKHARQSPNLSLGVGTFNMRQQLAIQDEIESRRRLNPQLDAFCNQNNDEAFFVKNLENIQGDERDVIFISVTYGKSLDGNLRYNFGPINGENGWRRLNVLASRARRRMKVFSSIRAEDISLVGLTSVGAGLLRRFLAYAESGKLDQNEISQSAETESPFEFEVYMELTRRGVKVTPQVGVTGYRIDLGILDDNHPGRYICGIECDGVSYHASETARDRDRLRQQVLENRGWTIYRIWSTDWFKDRTGQITRIMELIENAREKAKSDETNRLSAKLSEAELSTNLVSKTLDDVSQASFGIDQGSEVGEESNPIGYVRPIALNYEFAKNNYIPTSNILNSSSETLVQAINTIVKKESPIHVDVLVDRVVEFWDTKAGRKIVEHIKLEISVAIRKKLVIKKGYFLYANQDTVPVRSRNGLKFAPEHISHEEYREALLLVLRTGFVFPRKKLTSEVRSILGFGRTTSTMDELINRAIDDLISNGVAGDASNGVALRSSN